MAHDLGITTGVAATGLFAWEYLKNPTPLDTDKTTTSNLQLTPGGLTLQF